MKKKSACAVNPTLACGNLLNFEGDLDILEKTGIQMVHIDIMDGHYVPNLCFNVDTVAAIRKNYSFFLDVHLMVSNPEFYLRPLQRAGADAVSFHQDVVRFPIRLLKQIHQLGMKGGIVLNPVQQVESLIELLPYLDFVVVMGVEPGFSGQRFLERTIDKVGRLDKFRMELPSSFLIEVDGGIDFDNTVSLVKNGADVLVSGAFGVFSGKNSLEEDCRKYQEFVKTC